MTFYQFATESPWLTFFLFLVVGVSVAEAAKGLGRFRFTERRCSCGEKGSEVRK